MGDHGSPVSPLDYRDAVAEDVAIGEQYRPNRATRRGYTRNRKVYVLKFEDPDCAGLVVKAQSVPLGTFMGLIDFATMIEDGDGIGPEQAKAIRGLFTGFAGALREWNLLDDKTGEPVPATLDGLYGEDTDWVLMVIRSWMDAVAGVAGPLGQRSGSGAPSPGPSLPMAPPSPNLTS